MMNKKGVETTIYGIFAIIALILILIAYWVFFVLPTAALNPVAQTVVGQDKSNFNLLLLNYLRTPVKVEDNDIIMSDLIRIYVEREGYDETLKEESKNVFDYALEGYEYSLTVNGKDIINTFGSNSEGKGPNINYGYGTMSYTMGDSDSFLTSKIQLPGITKGLINVELKVKQK